MSKKPIFLATHPRACSTAFERVFMTRQDILHCVHEPFGDAFYFGPERLSGRFEDDEELRVRSGFDKTTYKTVLDGIYQASTKGKRLFIKDIIHYLIPPDGKASLIAPSLASQMQDFAQCSTLQHPCYGTDGLVPYSTYSEAGNPTVIPKKFLQEFHFTFLIRHPRYSVPSYFRCTTPPLDKVTGFYEFMPSEIGIKELRRFFDYLHSINLNSPNEVTQNDDSNAEMGNGTSNICIVDADDMLDNPAKIIQNFCGSVGITFNEAMLNWENDEDKRIAEDAFEKWKGFHEDAIQSSGLKQRLDRNVKSDEDLYSEWSQKYGVDSAELIKATVDANLEDYEFLKQFAIKP